ncbi:MAG: ATP-binding protein [Clostridia bacterium]|nr:ATP-binding protein [Clostridia bacterium]
MKKRILEQVLSDLKHKVQARENALADLRLKAFENPEISKAQAEYARVKFDALMKGVKNDENIKKARLNYENALKKYGYGENAFEYQPICSKCNDTGFVDGKICSCVYNEYIARLKNECDIEARAPFSFADSNTSKMTREQTDAINKLYGFSWEYVSMYPNVKKHILVFMGATGTGKSCLAQAIARKAVDHGKSALVYSAYEFNTTCLNCHLAPIDEKDNILYNLMTADFVVIDDLGTEPMLKNVTCEYLQLILDERLRSGLTTIITTNLSEIQLKERYGERIFSRLCDAKHSLMRRIPGKDLRLS